MKSKIDLKIALITGIFLGIFGSIKISQAEIIPFDRRIDWQGHAGVPSGIPNRTTICATINVATYGHGSVDASSAINIAIDNCPENQVVFLPAGTYRLDDVINFGFAKNVTLRGAGRGQTILAPRSYAAIISGESGLSEERRIISGSTKGSTSITVDNASGIHVGSILDISEANDPDFVWSRWGDTDLLRQRVIVTGISGNTVQFQDPLVWNFSLNPRWQYQWYDGMRFSGVEDLTIRGDQTYEGTMIKFFETYGCWIKNVETAWGAGNEHIQFYGGLRNEVRDSYIHDTYSETDGYGILAYSDCAGFLIENNIFSGFFVAMILEGDSGFVVDYNFARDSRLVFWPNYQVPDYNSNHGPHGIMHLWEGNVGVGFQSDGYHGSTSHQTIFRNWFSAQHSNSVRTGNIKTIDLCRFSYYHNVVGNILGFGGWPLSGVYEMTGNPDYTDQPTVYRLGYPDMGNNWYDPVNPPSDPDSGGLDPKVKMTLLRHGNYDYFHKSIIWDPNIADHTFPVSLYYSSRPSWWCAESAWPPIGPDVVGYTNKIPAQRKFENLPCTKGNTDNTVPSAPGGLVVS